MFIVTCRHAKTLKTVPSQRSLADPNHRKRDGACSVRKAYSGCKSTIRVGGDEREPKIRSKLIIDIKSCGDACNNLTIANLLSICDIYNSMLSIRIIHYPFPPQCPPHLPRGATYPLSQNLPRSADVVPPDCLVPSAEGRCLLYHLLSSLTLHCQTKASL